MFSRCRSPYRLKDGHDPSFARLQNIMSGNASHGSLQKSWRKRGEDMDEIMTGVNWTAVVVGWMVAFFWAGCGFRPVFLARHGLKHMGSS